MKTAGQGASSAKHQSSRPAGLPAGTVSWIEVDLESFRHNVHAFRQRIGQTSALAAVVKSNAYGHGVALCGPAALQAGASWLAVGGLAEALELRSIVGPTVPILTLNHVPAVDLEEAVAHDIRVTIYSDEAVAALARGAERTKRVARAHLKVETGTYRQGVDPAQVVALARQIAATPGLEFEGLSTHFADIEDTTDHRFAQRQRQIFDDTVAQLTAADVAPKLRHIACSAATILFPETHAEIARAGIGIYGLWPSRETLVSSRERGLPDFTLRPVMSWRCLIAQVKDVPVGGYVGYGRTWRATRPTRLAVLPVGYYEGYDRGISGRGHVLIGGNRAPLLGRICMNMSMVDVTDIPNAQAGDVATLLGRMGDEEVRVEDLAGWAGTIHYEIVARVHPSLPRIAVS